MNQAREEATRQAQAKSLRPVTFREVRATYDVSSRLNIPYLGDHVPEGWVRVTGIEPVEVDLTGLSRGKVMSRGHFMRWIRSGINRGRGDLGLGILEIGATAQIAIYAEVR